MIWAGHVARMEKRKGPYRFLMGNIRERDHLEELGVDGRIVSKLILKKWVGEARTGFSWPRNKWRALVNAIIHLQNL